METPLEENKETIPLEINFKFDGENCKVVIMQVSDTLKLTLKKPLSQFYWVAQLAKEERKVFPWVNYQDVSSAIRFVAKRFQENKVSIKKLDERKLHIIFKLDLESKVEDLILEGIPTETTPEELNLEFADKIKEIDLQLTKEPTSKLKWGISRIISLEDYSYLREWINPENPGSVGLELLFRGTRDGFTSASFHEKCNGKGPTVCVIKSTLGLVFGGFTSAVWANNNAYFPDDTAFTFSLTYKQKNPIKPGSNAMYDHSSHLCTFGNGNDFIIANNCANQASSSSAGNNSYPLPEGVNPNLYYAGTSPFFVKEVEVYLVSK